MLILSKHDDIPVMKCFVEANNYFLYDTYTNSLFNIQKEHFIELSRLQNCGLHEYIFSGNSSVAHNDIIHLIEKGFLKDHFVEKLAHPLEDYIASLCSRCINDISLQVTKNCNLKCRYCLFAGDTPFERNHERIDMPWEIAKKSIDFLFMHSKDADSLNISFYGGEPLLNFPLIVRVVEYAEQLFYSKKINYIMTTNAVLLNDTIINFLVTNDFSLSISLDENEIIHNRHRKMGATGIDTYGIVLSNVERIKELCEDYFYNKVSFIPALFPDEDYDYESSVFKKLSVRKENINPTDVNLQGIDYIHSNQNNLSIKQEEKEDNRLQMVLEQSNVIPSCWYPNGQCVPGIKRVFVNTEGVFYPCEKVVELSGLSIGNLFTGLNIDVIKDFLNIAKLTESDCKQCWAMRFCCMCISDCSDTENGINVTKKRMICEAYRRNVLRFLKKMSKRSIR